MFFALLVLFTTSSPLTPHLITEELRQLIKKIQQTSQNREVGFIFFFAFIQSSSLFIYFVFGNISKQTENKRQVSVYAGERSEVRNSRQFCIRGYAEGGKREGEKGEKKNLSTKQLVYFN